MRRDDPTVHRWAYDRLKTAHEKLQRIVQDADSFLLPARKEPTKDGYTAQDEAYETLHAIMTRCQTIGHAIALSGKGVTADEARILASTRDLIAEVESSITGRG